MKSQETLSVPDTTSSYSNIISPQKYNEIMSEQHLYIRDSDKYIREVISEKIKGNKIFEIVELGCGPGRLFPLMTTLTNINYTAIDTDPDFILYAKNSTKGYAVNIVQADITDYQFEKSVDVFFSQGMHHHIPKATMTDKYLKNAYRQLTTPGYYVLSDEFIPDYSNEFERTIKLIIWYAHVIHYAMKSNFMYLAQEEAKTMLDDLHEGSGDPGFKNTQQIQFVLEAVEHINAAAMGDDLKMAGELALELLHKLDAIKALVPCGDNALDLSRGDYKICDSVFQDEIRKAGFIVEDKKLFSMNSNIGGMCVYTLRKD
jgi:SAM-dependent methyltransferase